MTAIDVRKTLTERPTPLHFILPGFLAGSVGTIISPGGVGKGFLAPQTAIWIAGDPDLLGFGDRSPGKVLYAPAEDPRLVVENRLHAMSRYFREDQVDLVEERLTIQSLYGQRPDIMDRRWFEAFRRAGEEYRLIIIDTLRRFHRLDENNAAEMASVVSQLEALAEHRPPGSPPILGIGSRGTAMRPD